jgi:tRNA A-37 threonylcarbamoyl transferase component Bud32
MSERTGLRIDSPAEKPLALSISDMAALSRLLDEALPLNEADRCRWLEALAPEYQNLTQVLREALSPAAIERSDYLKLTTLPSLGADDNAALVGAGGLQPGERLGPYELVRPLGAGGMAEVWLARRADGAFKRDVALKLPLLMRSRRDLEPRFAREREILASLAHPNIARLYDAGFTRHGQPYLALEYVAGTPLTSYCDERRLTLRERLELFGQVLSAVQYAHANLVIHRDLKPSNILVTEEGQVRLLDFGIAKLLSDGKAMETELTQVAGRALTPDYAAPEQIAGAAITTAADVYSLGVMFYEMLTGMRPYRLKRGSRSALEDAILNADPVAPSRVAVSENAAEARSTSPRKLASALKGELDTISMKALKKSPGERYATANAFAEDISRFLRGEVVLAQPESVAYRATKFAKRHWVTIAVVSTLLLTLTGGLAATIYEARIAAVQRDIAFHEAATSDQVTNYLVSLFDLASPDRTGGKAIDARTLVDEGQRQIAAVLGNQPLLRERILAAVGALDCKIGRSDQCRQNLEEALRIRSAQHDGDPLMLAQLQYQLGAAYALAGRSNEAIVLLRSALPVYEGQRPQNPVQLAGLWYQLGFAERLTKQPTEAQAALEKARKLLKDSRGHDTLQSADTLGQLSIVYAEGSRPNDAIDLAAKRLELVRDGFGTADLRYFDALDDYAEVANNLNEADVAEDAWRKVVNGYASLVGHSSDKTINAELSLADALYHQNKLHESIQWFSQSVQDYRSQGNLNTVHYIGALGGLSEVLVLDGDYRNAEAAQREAYEISQRMGGPTPWEAAAAALKWGNRLALTGDTERAMELLKPEMPGDSRAALTFKGLRLVWIGDCYRQMGKPAPAEASYDAALAFFRSINRPPQSVSLNMAYEGKAMLLASEQRHHEAVDLYRIALDGYSSGKYVPNGPSIAAVKVELAESLLALGQRVEARSLVDSSGAVIDRELAPTHPARILLNQLRKAMRLPQGAEANSSLR